MSKLELILGPMFSQKCLSPETSVWNSDKQLKLVKQLKVGDVLLNDRGEPTTILSINSGTAQLYRVNYHNFSYFDATENHVLSCKYYNYSYQPFSEKRGILYFFDKNKEFKFFPILLKNLPNELKKINMLPRNSTIEITIKNFLVYKQYSKMLYVYNYNSKLDYFNSKDEVLLSLNNIIDNGDLNAKKCFIRAFINKFKIKEIEKESTVILGFDWDKEFRYKIFRLVDDIEGLVIGFQENEIFLYIKHFHISDKENTSFVKIKRKKIQNYIGFELDGNGRFLLGDFLVSHNSTFLINIINKYKIIDKNIIVISHSLDKTRYSKYFLSTHNDDSKIPCKFIDNLSILNGEEEFKNADIVIIEEAQFFKDIEEFVCFHLDNSNKHFIISGLSSDINRKPFYPFINLVSHADKIHKLEGFCNVCKNTNPGIYTKLLNDENKSDKQNPVLIGSSNYYTTVCREHY